MLPGWLHLRPFQRFFFNLLEGENDEILEFTSLVSLNCSILRHWLLNIHFHPIDASFLVFHWWTVTLTNFQTKEVATDNEFVCWRCSLWRRRRSQKKGVMEKTEDFFSSNRNNSIFRLWKWYKMTGNQHLEHFKPLTCRIMKWNVFKHSFDFAFHRPGAELKV